MRKLIAILSAIAVLLFFNGDAYAWHARGNVLCEADGIEGISPGDIPLPGVRVNVTNNTETITDLTDAAGSFYISLPDYPDTYTETLAGLTLPSFPKFLIPSNNEHTFELTDTVITDQFDWLIGSPDCRDEEFGCWLTGGGVKFFRVANGTLAEFKSNGNRNGNSGGPAHNFGGNVYPSCSPEPGDGGQWNHLDKENQLHFLGESIEVVRCDNVPGIPEGSESLVTPYNFIEFMGTGTLKRSVGNDEGFPACFFARAEDRNEPGNEQANNGNGGDNIDRYWILVYDCFDGGETLILLGTRSGDTCTDPVTITGGNLQLHASSCD